MTIWIGYTTRYREGGAKFERVAKTLSMDRSRARPGERVVARAVESKREFVESMAEIGARGEALRELHFVGHSGMYGPMFRTTSMPEQFSPHEWRNLEIPFAADGEAFFHACRSARWFAPFFARTFKVPSHGYHLYTTFSKRPDRFVWESPLAPPNDPLWVVALPGKKSHGPAASILKYAHVLPTEPMKRFDPLPRQAAAETLGSYDEVATLYDEVFSDIGVRRREVEWIESHLETARGKRGVRVLEIGTGNGALLGRLAPGIESGVGVDASKGMIAQARRRFGNVDTLRFEVIDGPSLPVADASVDVVISMLSWRYLDWDPMMSEIRRVLADGGRLLVVDMVALPAKLREAGALVRAKVDQLQLHARRPQYRRALTRMVRDPRWKTMLDYNPIRAEHEYRWYFESRFPRVRLETLSVALSSRVVAVDSGPLDRGFTLPQSYP